MKKTTFLLTAVLGLTGAAALGSMVFQENFGSLANTTTISTSNTSLDYVRVGTGGGSISAKEPSSFTGSSAVITGPSNTSLNGIGGFGATPFNLVDFKVDFRLLNTTGNVVFGVGSGTTFTGNNAFSTAQGLFWLQTSAGQLQRRTSTWVNVGDALSSETNYSMRVVANASTEPLSYDSLTLAAGTMSIFLNDSVVASAVPVTTSLSADAFRIYSVSGANVELDNISVFAIPEPGTLMLIGFAGLTGYAALRRRRI